MKVGKKTVAVSTPIGVTIWATNMVPVTVWRFDKDEARFNDDVSEVIMKYEENRKRQAEQFGELDQ